MAEPRGTEAITDEQRQAAKDQLDTLVKPMMTESSRFVSGDGTIDNPVTGTINDQLTDQQPQGTQASAPDPFDTEYAAASNASEKANVAAKHGHFQEAFGNSQNIVGEMRGQLEELRTQRDTLLQREAAVPAQQAMPQQTPQQALANHQFVQPKDEYDTEAQRMNELGRAITSTLAAGIDQAYGSRFQEVVNELDNLKRMPSNYSVDAATEATLARELQIENLPSWQQKSIIQRIAGGNNTNTPPVRTRTVQERKVGQAVNYVEPSSPTANAPTEQDSQQKVSREYERIGREVRDPQERIRLRKQLLIDAGVEQVDDWRR